MEARKFTFLLVDDDESVLKLIARILEADGHRVLSAVNSDEAMRLSDEFADAIDVLIVDQVIPPFMSGSELAECMRMLRPQIKVVYISGYQVNHTIQDELGEKSAMFIQKPFEPDILRRKIRKLVG